jgi:RHS repeat-associated protein
MMADGTPAGHVSGADAAIRPLARTATARSTRSSHPVIIATGEKSLDHLDFELPGPIELEWRRQYRSGDARSDGWFGQGWTHALATELWLEDDVLRYWDEQGREVLLPAIAVGQEHFQAYEQFTLTRPGDRHWALRHNQGLTHHFRQRHPGQTRLPLEVLQDRNARRVALKYDERDFAEDFDAGAVPPRPQRLVDSAGRTLLLVWTAAKQLGEVLVEAGEARVVMARYQYGATALGQGAPDLLSHTDANGHARTYAWEQHLLVGYTLATGQRFSNRYDRLLPTGRVTESLALDDGTGDRFDYNGRTTRVQDRLGRETVYVSNARQDIVAVHDAAGNVTRNDFDAEGRPEGSTDPLGRSSSTTFDVRGSLVQMVDAAGNATKVEYNALDLPVKLTDAMGGEWLRQYDVRGNLIASTDPLGHTTLYEVDARGQVIGIIDALDKRKTLAWDEAGNLVSYTDCSGHTTRQAYDDLGHLRSSTDALGQETVYAFDAHGQLLQVTQPDGAQHRYTWDGEGNLVRYVDPLGQATTWQYNGAAAPTLRVDALGHKLRYAYDAAGRLAVLTNENGEHTHFGYDRLDRLTDEIGFDGRHQRYCYNAAGELTHVVEHGGSEFGPGKVTRFERDALGRMTAKQHVGEAAEHAASSRFAYDALGRLTQANNAWSEVSFAYDPLGQLLAENQALSAAIGGQVFEFKHQYDPLGNRTQTVLPNGRALNHLFYGSGHLHQVNLDGEVVSNFERDALFREVRRTQGALYSEFAYDRAGRLSAQRVMRDSAAGAGAAQDAGLTSVAFPSLAGARGMSDIQGRLKGVIERHYQYDPSGQLVQWLDRHRGLTRYGYDAAGRITRSQIGLLKDWGAVGVRADAAGNGTGHPMAANEQFQWDAASNPLPVGADSGAGGARSFVRGNRLLVWQDARYAYDEHGNLIERLQGKRGSASQVRTAFTWGAAHQLVRADVARGPDEAAVVQSFAYAYDALGRRVAKRDAFGITLFGWDGNRIALERRGGSETVYLHYPESFLPLAQMHDGVLHHVHTDHLGTPLEASNDDGEVTWRVTYRAWGNTLVKDVERIQQHLRLLGQYFDAETGLHYSRFRHYDPSIGRFVTEDPIGLAGGTNLFVYAPNPITWVDPFGLAFAHVRFPAKKIIVKVTIKMQGSRDDDFREANRKAKLFGCRGKPTIDSHKLHHGDVTWHHATYNKKTNTAVMELVLRVDHEATFPHAGSVSDFEKAHGVDYESDEAIAAAEELNKKCPCS